MIQTYQITVLNQIDMSENCQFAVPFLPRVGDNIVLDDVAVTILNVTIHANHIMVSKGQPDSKIVTMNNQHQSHATEDELIIPIVALCDIHELQEQPSGESKNK